MEILKSKYEQLGNLLKSKSSHQKILLIGDGDPDGITSCFVFTRLLEQLEFSYKNDFNTWIVNTSFRNIIQTDTAKQDEIRKYDIIIFFDYSLNDYSFLKDKITVVIDHHKLRNDVTIEINPAFSEAKFLPSSSALSYGAYKVILGKEDIIVKKIGYLGSISDWMVYGSLETLNIDIDDSEYLIQRMISPPYTNLLRIFSLLSDSKMGQSIYHYMIDNVKDSLIPLSILPKDWTKRIDKIDAQKNKVIESISKKVEHFEDLIFLNVTLKEGSYGYAISSFTQLHYHDKTSIQIKKLDNKQGYTFSARSHSLNLVNMINFLKENVQDLKGGGHPFAAGFYCKPKQYKLTLKLIKENYKRFLK